MRKRVGRSERAARKRHGRVWVGGGKGMNVFANFHYFHRYPEAESPPLKLGRKHYARRFSLSLTETVSDSRNEQE